MQILNCVLYSMKLKYEVVIQLTINGTFRCSSYVSSWSNGSTSKGLWISEVMVPFETQQFYFI